MGLLQKLQYERDALKTEGKELRAKADAEGAYTDEQRARRDEIVARVTTLESDITAEMAMQEYLRNEPVDDDAPSAEMPAAPAPRLFDSLGEQLKAVYDAARNPRAADPRLWQINASTGASEAIGFDGGFLVQSDFQPGLMQRVYDGAVLAPACDNRPVGSNANGVTYNVVDETSRANGSRAGGVRGYWVGEGASLTASRPKLAQQELKLSKLTGLYYATDELLADATALEGFVSAEFAKEFAFMLDDAIVRGTGTGQPQGILNANALVTISKETGQSATTLVAENIEKMFAAIWGPSLGNAAWYINQDVWPQIFQLNHAVGTGGVPMFVPAGGLTDAPAGLLLGRPIRPIEQAATLGTVGDVILADMSEYLLINKGGVQSASSIHVAFTTDEMAFRWVLRTNGRSKWLSALTPFKGSQTRSPFVALATRS